MNERSYKMNYLRNGKLVFGVIVVCFCMCVSVYGYECVNVCEWGYVCECECMSVCVYVRVFGIVIVGRWGSKWGVLWGRWELWGIKVEIKFKMNKYFGIDGVFFWMLFIWI